MLKTFLFLSLSAATLVHSAPADANPMLTAQPRSLTTNVGQIKLNICPPGTFLMDRRGHVVCVFAESVIQH